MIRDTLVFDIETVADAESARRLLGSPDLSDIQARDALAKYFLDKTDGKNDFPRQPFHQVVAISYVHLLHERDAHGSQWILKRIASGGVAESSEKELLEGLGRRSMDNLYSDYELGVAYLQQIEGSKQLNEDVKAVKDVGILRNAIKKEFLIFKTKKELVQGVWDKSAACMSVTRSIPSEILKSDAYKDYKLAVGSYERAVHNMQGDIGLHERGRQKPDKTFARRAAGTLLAAFCGVVVAVLALAPTIALTMTGVLPALVASQVVVMGCIALAVFAYQTVNTNKEVGGLFSWGHKQDMDTNKKQAASDKKFVEDTIKPGIEEVKKCAEVLSKLAEKEPKLDISTGSSRDSMVERIVSKSKGSGGNVPTMA